MSDSHNVMTSSQERKAWSTSGYLILLEVMTLCESDIGVPLKFDIILISNSGGASRGLKFARDFFMVTRAGPGPSGAAHYL